MARSKRVPSRDEIFCALREITEGSEHELKFRNELIEWCKSKLKEKNRPVDLQVALIIVSEMMADCDVYNLR